MEALRGLAILPGPAERDERGGRHRGWRSRSRTATATTAGRGPRRSRRCARPGVLDGGALRELARYHRPAILDPHGRVGRRDDPRVRARAGGRADRLSGAGRRPDRDAAERTDRATMAIDPDPYRTLGLLAGRDRATRCKRAYRRLAKVHHPDAAGESALPRFLAIQAAYEQLLTGAPAATRGRRAAAAPREPGSRPGPSRRDPPRYGGRRARRRRRCAAAADRAEPRVGARDRGRTGRRRHDRRLAGRHPPGRIGPTGSSRARRDRAAGPTGRERRPGRRPSEPAPAGADAGRRRSSDRRDCLRGRRRRDDEAQQGDARVDLVRRAPTGRSSPTGAARAGTARRAARTGRSTRRSTPTRASTARSTRPGRRAARARRPRPARPTQRRIGRSAPAGRRSGRRRRSARQDADRPADPPPSRARPPPADPHDQLVVGLDDRRPARRAIRGPPDPIRRRDAGRGPATAGDRRRRTPPPDVGRAAADIVRALDRRRGSAGVRGRVARAVVGWLPIALRARLAARRADRLRPVRGDLRRVGRAAGPRRSRSRSWPLLLVVPAVASIADRRPTAGRCSPRRSSPRSSCRRPGRRPMGTSRRATLGAVLLIAWLASGLGDRGHAPAADRCRITGRPVS